MSESTVPIAVPASTILLVRDGDTGLEVFMVVRHHQIDFASGALVFPGGKTDAGDSEVRDLCTGADGLDDAQLAIRVGAIREAFEECGVLLARRTGTNDRLVNAAELLDLDAMRGPLQENQITLRDFLMQNELTLACELLTPYAHWITPDMMPKRFDTYFYIAAAPDDQIAVHDGEESVDSVWISPTDAIKGSEDGRYTVIYPTLKNIEMLGESDSAARAITDATNRPVVTVLPVTEKRADGNYLVIPADAGYRGNEQKMPDRARNA
jgi:8-oxo-dGTP pyrophosphatase MutT (NUDIX family)